MKMLDLTIYYKATKDGVGFIGCIPELGGVGSQGRTLDELKDNLFDAARAMMAFNKWSSLKEIASLGSWTKYEMENDFWSFG